MLPKAISQNQALKVNLNQLLRRALDGEATKAFQLRS
jgi:hypothetical protein